MMGAAVVVPLPRNAQGGEPAHPSPRRRGRPKEWPTRRTFEVESRGNLLWAVKEHGGVERWAAEFGLAVPECGKPIPRIWTEERIRSELESFLGDRETWPTGMEFGAADKRGLFRAIAEGHGTAYWAREMGIALVGRQERLAPLSDAEALEESRAVVARHGRLLGASKLRELGHSRLASYVQARGGSAQFAREQGWPERRRADAERLAA